MRGDPETDKASCLLKMHTEEYLATFNPFPDLEYSFSSEELIEQSDNTHESDEKHGETDIPIFQSTPGGKTEEIAEQTVEGLNTFFKSRNFSCLRSK